MFRTTIIAGLAAVALAASLPLASPARAQLGGLFGDPAPRPPGSVPRGNPNAIQMPQDDEEDVPELPQGRLLPTPTRPAPGQGAPPPGVVQSQPLAPTPATTVIPQNAPGTAQPNVAVAPPAANPSPNPRGSKVAPPTPATLQPGDEVVTDAPAQKIINKKASFSGLDKITGRIINFDADIGETVQFGALRVKTDACYTRPATEAANTDAFVEVDEITLQGEVKRIFSGWMFAASPGLHGVEHPIYDIWLTDCKGPEATVATAAPDLPKPPPPAPRRAAPKQQPRPQPVQPVQPAPFPAFR